jgi:hypothetical protein
VSVLIRRSAMVCKIRNDDLDGTWKHEEWFEGSRCYCI